MGEPVGEGNFEASVRFLTGWVSDGAAEARAYLAGHAEPAGASLIAVHGDDVAGYVALLWESNFAGFRDRGIPLVHQLAVAGPFPAARCGHAPDGRSRAVGRRAGRHHAGCYGRPVRRVRPGPAAVRAARLCP